MNLITFVIAAILHLAPQTENVEELATAIATASEESPIDHDAKLTASLLIATAYRESGFTTLTGDGRKSVGFFHHWCMPDRELCYRIITDWTFAARLAVQDLKEALRVCRDDPLADRLSWYLAGKCGVALGQSRDRWYIARWLAKNISGNLALGGAQ